jgi:indolepyruvate ferredoxin oxidoreductase beta subunit
MKSLNVFITGVGGQGTLLASRILGEAAILAGLGAVVGEVHGMAQRGGVVESVVVMGARRGPVLSEGEADVLLGFEPMETLRGLRMCNPETLVVSNLTPVVPFTVTCGQAEYPDVDSMMKQVEAAVGRLVALDADRLAKDAGSPLAMNVVLVGALAGTNTLPFDAELLEDAIKRSVKPGFVDINIRAFRSGASAV